MLFAWIKATHYIGLALLLGGPAFWHLAWLPSRRAGAGPGRSDALFRRVTRAAMLAGLLLTVLSGLLDIMRAAAELFGSLIWEDFAAFATGSPMGRVILARLALAAVFFLAAVRLSERRLAWLAPLASGTGVLVLVSVLSHQAAKESVIPLVADVIHLLATSMWGGALLYFALVPWRQLREEPGGARRLAAVAGTFSGIGLLGVAALTLTGIYISTQQFYSVAAVTGTPYGLALLRKLAGYAAILAVAAVHHFYFVPGLVRLAAQAGAEGAAGEPAPNKQQLGAPAADGQGGPAPAAAEKALRLGTRFVVLVRAEAALLLAVLVLAGFLTTQMPPARPVEVAETASTSGSFGGNEYRLALFPRQNGQVMFELLVSGPDGRPLAVDGAEIDLTMTDHYMPPYILPLEPDGPGVYRATGILSMGGRWLATARWRHGGEAYEAVLAFNTTASLQQAQGAARYTWKAVTEKPGGVLLFVMYGALAAAGGYALVRGARLPRSLILLTIGAFLVAGSGMQMARLAEVPGPHTFRVNPVKRTAAVLARGAELYRANCMMCHGATGRGDGPVAAGLNPRPADFTAPNGIPQHSDGELFWWISKGIPGTSMPAFEAILTEEERWIVVHYIRTFSESTVR